MLYTAPMPSAIGAGHSLESGGLDAAEPDRPTLVFLRDASLRKRLRHAYDMQQTLLDEAMESIVEGLWVFDANLNLVMANGRMREMLQLPDGLMTPGASFQESMRYCIGRGDYGDGDPDALLADRMEVFTAYEPVTFERGGPDGRTFEVVDPATGHVIAHAPLGGVEDVERAVAGGGRAPPRGPDQSLCK